MLLGFDPGRDKCGIAVMSKKKEILQHEVVQASDAIHHINQLQTKYSIEMLIMGNQTTAKAWRQQLTPHFAHPIVMIDERYSTQEARIRYWEMYPAKGFTRFIPVGMRIPPRPVDDIVAIILLERYLS